MYNFLSDMDLQTRPLKSRLHFLAMASSPLVAAMQSCSESFVDSHNPAPFGIVSPNHCYSKCLRFRRNHSAVKSIMISTKTIAWFQIWIGGTPLECWVRTPLGTSSTTWSAVARV